MAMRDCVEGRRWTRQCRTCGRLFVTSTYQQLSCSDRCTWNYHKRKQRTDERFLTRDGPQEARRLAGLGLCAREIHERLQSEVGFTLSRALIRDWVDGTKP